MFRYRVYLENDDYDDMSSSMESSAIVDYAVLDKKVKNFSYPSILYKRVHNYDWSIRACLVEQ